MQREDAFEYQYVWRVDASGLLQSSMLLEGVDRNVCFPPAATLTEHN